MPVPTARRTAVATLCAATVLLAGLGAGPAAPALGAAAPTRIDPAKLARFDSFVNAPTTPDPGLAYVPERGQLRPARPEERERPGILIAGTTLEVRR